MNPPHRPNSTVSNPPFHSSFLVAWLAFLVLTLTTVTVAETPDTIGNESEPSLTEQIIAEETPLTIRAGGLGRIGFSHPQGLSARLGTVFSKQPAAFECVSTCDHIGPLIQIEAGTGGAQISAGFARILGDRRRDGFFFSDVYVGFGLKGALLRTFGNAARQHRHRTYLGAEGEFTITNFNLTVGVFRRVSDEPTDDRWLTVLGMGWGF